FVPTQEQDPSLRISSRLLKLFPPFIDVSTTDALSSELLEKPTDRFFLGRALWGALINSGMSIERVIETAESKLLGGITNTDLQSILQHAKPDNQLAIATAIISVLVS